MKFVKYILGLLLILAAVTCDLFAQSSSSARQTVTFGVRRSAPVVVASAQSSSLSIKEYGAVRTSPLKISVGSGMRSEVLANFEASDHGSFAQTSDIAQTSNLPLKKTSKALPPSADQPVITLTE